LKIAEEKSAVYFDVVGSQLPSLFEVAGSVREVASIESLLSLAEKFG